MAKNETNTTRGDKLADIDEASVPAREKIDEAIEKVEEVKAKASEHSEEPSLARAIRAELHLKEAKKLLDVAP